MMTKLLQKLERICTRWFKHHKYNIIFVFLFFVVIQIASRLPYFNLLLTPNNLNLLLLTFVVAFLVQRSKTVMLFGLLLFILAMFFDFVGRKETVELIGDWIYLILSIAMLKGVGEVCGHKEE